VPPAHGAIENPAELVRTILIYVIPAAASVVITIDKSVQRMTVTVDGATRWTWPVSTGARRYDTPNGNYTAFRMEKEINVQHRARTTLAGGATGGL
jgi:hypothetical protein